MHKNLLGLRLHLKRPHVAHRAAGASQRSEHDSRSCEIPLNFARSAIVRFLQLAPLSLADAQQDAGGNHADGADPRQSHPAPKEPQALVSNDVSASAGNPQEHPTNNQNSSGADEPDPRSPHTKIHLLKRVSVDRPWRAWRNVNTGRG